MRILGNCVIGGLLVAATAAAEPVLIGKYPAKVVPEQISEIRLTENGLITDLAEEGKTVLTLGVADGIVAFRQPAAETIKANKVYLLVDAASSAKIRIVEGETTGIEENYEFGIRNCVEVATRKKLLPAKSIKIKLTE